MNNQRIKLYHIILLVLAFVILPLGGTTIAQIGIESLSVENIKIEQGVNKCFIVCKPNINSEKDLQKYIDKAHDRLSNANQSFVANAIVTFVQPLTQNDFEKTVLGMPIKIISTKSVSESLGLVVNQYPFPESEVNTDTEIDGGSEIVSMRVTSKVSSLSVLSLHSNVFCVDAGAVDQLSRYANAMVILPEDLYQSAITFNSANKLTLGTIPDFYSLSQNYPNPFNPTTEILFSLTEATEVKLEIYNTLGQLVTTLFEGDLEAGTHSYEWDASNSASGMYLYRLSSDDFSSTKKMLLLK